MELGVFLDIHNDTQEWWDFGMTAELFDGGHQNLKDEVDLREIAAIRQSGFCHGSILVGLLVATAAEVGAGVPVLRGRTGSWRCL